MGLKANALFVASFMSILFVGMAQASPKVIVEYFTVIDTSRFQCPECGDVVGEIVRVNNIVRGVDWEYGDLVHVEWLDVMTPEGHEQFQEYNLDLAKIPTIIVNYTYRMDGKDVTREILKSVIDDYLEGREPAPSPTDSFNLYSEISFAFSLGFFDTFSPCLIAMLSFILSYTVGKTILFKEGMLRVMTFGIGFVSAAVLLGAAVALTLIYMPSYMPGIQGVLMWIICIFVILFGLNLLGLLNVPIQTKPLVKKLTGKYATTYMGLLLLGFVFYFLDPCIAPFAFTMLMMLQNFEFILPLLAFCLGAIIPFIGIGIVAGYASKLARSSYKHRSKIRAISGLILIIYALYIVIFYLF